MRSPRVRLLSLALVASITVGASALVNGGIPAAAASGTTLAGVTLAADMTSLTGSELARLTVGLHLTDPSGVDQAPGVIGGAGETVTCPCARLATDGPGGYPTSAGQAVDVRDVQLTLTSGNAQDGTWTGVTTVGAAGHGHWQLVAVIAGTLRRSDPGQTSWYAVDGSSYGPGVAISGSHWPSLSVQLPARPVPYPQRYVLAGRVVDSDSGGPMAGIPLKVQNRWDGNVPVNANTLTSVTTDSDGRWSFSTTDAGPPLVMFGAEQISPSEPPGGLNATSAVSGPLCCRWAISLSTHRSGATRYIDVRYSRGVRARLRLQRRTSDGWKELIERDAPATGRFSFSTGTPGLYRVRITDRIGSTDYPRLRTATSPALRIS